jgi:uncharacterized membrane protein
MREGASVSSGLIRWCGLAATLGGVLGIVLTPILTYLWATYSDVYGYFGRAYFLVFLGCLVGLAGLYARRRANSGLRGTEELEMERLVLGMTFVGLAIALVGSILDYWGGGSGEGFTQVQITGFGLETTGILLVLLGSLLLGLTYRRTNVLPRLVRWLLIAAGPGGLLLSFLHIPSGSMLLFCCAWVVLGYLLLMGKVSSAEQASRVS